MKPFSARTIVAPRLDKKGFATWGLLVFETKVCPIWYSPFPSQLWPNALWVKSSIVFFVFIKIGHFYDASHFLEILGAPHACDAKLKGPHLVDPKKTVLSVWGQLNVYACVGNWSK